MKSDGVTKQQGTRGREMKERKERAVSGLPLLRDLIKGLDKASVPSKIGESMQVVLGDLEIVKMEGSCRYPTNNSNL